MLICLAIAAVVGVAPTVQSKVAVVPVVRTNLINAPLALRIEDHVRRVLEGAGVAVQPSAETQQGLAGHPPESCEGTTACFALLGKLVEAWAVVRVEAAEVAQILTVSVQAIDVATGKVLGEERITLAPAALDEMFPPKLEALAARLGQLQPPARVVDVPPAPLALPQTAPAPLARVQRAGAGKGLAGPVVTGAGALLLGGTAAAFFVMGLTARSCLNGPAVDGQPMVCVPVNQVAGVQQRADVGLVVGSVASAAAVGLAATALVLLVKN